MHNLQTKVCFICKIYDVSRDHFNDGTMILDSLLTNTYNLDIVMYLNYKFLSSVRPLTKLFSNEKFDICHADGQFMDPEFDNYMQLYFEHEN